MGTQVKPPGIGGPRTDAAPPPYLATPDDGREGGRAKLLHRPVSLRVALVLALAVLLPSVFSLFGSQSSLPVGFPQHNDSSSRLGVQEMVRAVKRELEVLEDSSPIQLAAQPSCGGTTLRPSRSTERQTDKSSILPRLSSRGSGSQLSV